MNTKMFYLEEGDFDYLIQMLSYQSEIQEDNDKLKSLIKELEAQAS